MPERTIPWIHFTCITEAERKLNGSNLETRVDSSVEARVETRMETWNWRLRGSIWDSFWDGYLEHLWKAVRGIGKPEAERKQIDTGGRVEGTGPILAPGMGV